MGTTESKSHHDTSHLQNKQATPTDEDVNHTPVNNRRLIKLRDPRSPTDDVQRTPIIVPKPGGIDDSFDDPRSPTTIARTPIPDTDPRSPTDGVSRTPCPFTYPDPRSPTVNVARTPMLQESESGKFEMPSVDQSANIVKEEEKEEEIQNASNNNSSDTARLIDQSHKSEELATSSLASATQVPTNEDGLNSENDVTASGLTNETEEDDCQTQSLLTSGKEPSKKSRRPSLTKSIKAKINRSNSAPPRSPLSTRNLEKDAPTVHLHTGDGVITYDKAGSRRRQANSTPTRLAGKYEPMIDKENF